MKRIIEWLVKQYLPGWHLIDAAKPDLAKEVFKEIFPGKHLARNPQKGRKNKVKAVYIDPPYDKGGASNG